MKKRVMWLMSLLKRLKPVTHSYTGLRLGSELGSSPDSSERTPQGIKQSVWTPVSYIEIPILSQKRAKASTGCRQPHIENFVQCEKCRIARRARNAKYDLTPKSKAVNKRSNDKRNPKNDYAKTINKRTKYLSNGARGIKLFNRSIGYDLISPTGAIQL